MAQADPTLVSSKIWDRNATQVGANSGAHQDLGVTGWWKGGDGVLIELSGLGEGLGLLDLSHGESSNENEFTIPRSLQDLAWWEFRDVDLLVGVSHVSGVGDHLSVDDGEDGFDTDGVAGEYESLQHVHLGSSDLIVSILFIPGSVFIEPVVCLGLSVEGVAEVRWSWGSQPVGWSLGYQKIIYEFLILPLCIVLENTEAPRLCAYGMI